VFRYPELIQALEALLRHRTGGAGHRPGPAAPGAARRAAPDPGRPVRLIVVAVDGALVDDEGRLARETIEACRTAVGRGCAVVLATAQGPRVTASLMRELDIVGPTINCNGALIWNPVDARAQFHQPLVGDLVREICDRARAVNADVALRLQVLDRCYADRALRVAGADEEPDLVGSLDDRLDAPATMVGVIGAPAGLESVVGDLRQHLVGERKVALYRPHPNLLLVAHPRADKAVALQLIARRRSIPREQVMAIGAGAEDQAMVQWAGLGVAVENAVSRTRSLADIVVAGNHDLGAARAIHTYVLGSPKKGAK
jgi:hydroxymethylpyrimidine pyrophosphatase-like HAD family hydrolase